MIKAVIFDLDGTILYTLSDLANAMNEMLETQGFPRQEDLNVHRLAIGTGARNYVKKCLPEQVRDQEDLVDRCLLTYKEIYGKKSSIETKPYDGIFDVMVFLKQSGISINVLSNKPDEPTKALVELWFSEFQPTCVFGERIDFPRKPDPAVPLAIAETLGLQPEEVAFVGDSDVDIKTGINAGMVPIGVLWGYRDRDVLVESGAKLLAETPRDLITLIKNYQ